MMSPLIVSGGQKSLSEVRSGICWQYASILAIEVLESVVLSKIEPSFHRCFISMGFLGFIRHCLVSHKFYLLADTTLGYFFHVLKIKLSK